MAIEINGDKSLRRSVCKDLDGNSHEVEKIKVIYGNNEKKYPGLCIEYSFIMRKAASWIPVLFVPLPGMVYSSSSTFAFWFDMNNSQTADNFMWMEVLSVYVKGRVYVDTGDGTVFYDGSFEKTFTLQSTEYPPKTGNHREIYKTEGYISVVTHVSFDYIITYKDGIKRVGKYNNSFYAEYGVNADSLMEFRGKAEVVPDKNNGFEELVWTKDPLRVYRQQIESIIIVDVGVVSEYIGTYCGDDEYKYYCDNNPGIVVRIKDVAYAKASKIKSITLTGYAHILVNNTYLYKAKTETDTSTGNEVGSVISIYPGFDYLDDYEYSTALPRVEYSIKLEVTYEDGYVYTYNKSNLIYMSIEDTNNSSKRYNIETTAFPALKN